MYFYPPPTASRRLPTVLLSMTGFGDAHHQADGLAVAVEVRTINNRYFKFSMRSGEGYAALEPQVEGVVREQIKRGTVQVNLWVERAASPDDYSINAGVLESYRRQLDELSKRWKSSRELPIESLLALPGVVNEKRADLSVAEAEWPMIERTLRGRSMNCPKCAATRAPRWRAIWSRIARRSPPN